MISSQRIALFFVFLLFVASTSSAQSDRVALLTEVSGTVELARSGSTSFENAEWGTPLFEGDQIRTAASSQAVVLFSNNNMMTISGGNTFAISAGATSSPTSQSVSGAIISNDADLTLHRAGEGEIAVLGGLRDSGSNSSVTLNSPLNTKTASALPVFSWSVNDDFEMYRVNVLSSNGVIWTGETDTHTIAYPESAPALEPGTSYFWQVEAEMMLDVSKSELSSFEILSEEESSALRIGLDSLEMMYTESEQEANYHYLLGSLYAQYGVLGDAIQSFEWIANNHSESPLAHRILGNLYAEIGRKDAAINSLQKAVDLTQ